MKVIESQVVSTFENFICFDEKLWFTDMDTNELYSYDKKNDRCELFCNFDLEEKNGKRLFGQIIRVDKSLYLIPFGTKNMYRVDLRNKEVDRIDIYKQLINKKEEDKEAICFLSAHYFDGKIFMISALVPKIIEYDCKSEKAVCYDIGGNGVEVTSKDRGFCRKTLLKDKKIFIPLCGKNAVAVFDLFDRSTEFIEVGSSENRYSAICFDGESFWLAPRANGPIVRWQYGKKRYEEFNNFPKESRQNDFADVIFIDGKVYFIPMGAKTPLELNVKEKTIVQSTDMLNSNWMSQYVDGNNLYMFSAGVAQLFIIDRVVKSVTNRYILLPQKDVKECRRGLSKIYKILKETRNSNADIFVEDYEDALFDFQKYISDSNNKGDINQSTKQFSDKIYKELIRC